MRKNKLYICFAFWLLDTCFRHYCGYIPDNTSGAITGANGALNLDNIGVGDAALDNNSRSE